MLVPGQADQHLPPHQLAGGRFGVHTQIENSYGDTLTFQRLKNCHQICDRSGKPIQFGDDKNVAVPDKLQRRLELESHSDR